MSQTSLSFHNTISAKGAELDKLETRARSLEDQVLQMFYTTHKITGLTRADLIEKFKDRYTDVSCGRALSNLAKARKIEKTLAMRSGKYGSLNYVYKLIER